MVERAKREAEGTIDQIQDVIERLKKSPYSRRAVAITWNVKTDRKIKSPPCLTQITWNIKFDKLYQTVIFRSHDIFGAWVLNAFALRKLQGGMAREIGIRPGHLIIISNSAHIYENNWDMAKSILEKYYRGRFIEFERDKNGYFIIRIENNNIVVEHFLMDGRPSGYVFRGTEAQMLYRQILHENLISRLDHAAYLGHELARAEVALKENKKFVQDKA
jgi:thymidylate synthase